MNAEITTDTSGAKLCTLLQNEVDQIELKLQGGCDADAESGSESPSDDEDSDGHPERTPYSTRTGRSATRLRLY